MSLSTLLAGFVAVIIGYTSSAAIIFQAAAAAGASTAQISSWLWALGIGMGITSLGLSLYYRTPILTAWSTPGAALLVTLAAGATAVFSSLPQAESLVRQTSRDAVVSPVALILGALYALYFLRQGTA